MHEINDRTFDQDTIKLLLIELREYLPASSKFKEIAHFVAHPKRDRGIILDKVSYSYRRFKVLYFQTESHPHPIIDPNNIPEELVTVVLDHYRIIEPNMHVLKFLEKRFRKCDGGGYRIVGRVSAKLQRAIKDAISVLSVQAALDQDELILDLNGALVELQFPPIVNINRMIQNEFMLCILALLHQSIFILPDGNRAEAYIFTDQDFPDQDGNIILVGEVKPYPSKPAIMFPLISTTVRVSEHLGSDLAANFPGGIPFYSSNYHKETPLEVSRNQQVTLTLRKAENIYQ